MIEISIVTADFAFKFSQEFFQPLGELSNHRDDELHYIQPFNRICWLYISWRGLVCSKKIRWHASMGAIMVRERLCH